MIVASSVLYNFCGGHNLWCNYRRSRFGISPKQDVVFYVIVECLCCRWIDVFKVT